MNLPLEKIVLEPSLQPRNELNGDAIQQYAADMLAGDEFPPVEVYHVGGRYLLTSGWHRVLAAKRAGLPAIAALVTEGTHDDALWASCAANIEYDRSGSRRTNADKRKAVKMALEHPRAASMSGEEIARHCGVSNAMVSRLRADISYIVRDQERTVTRNGSTYQMNVANIGRAAPEPDGFFHEYPMAEDGSIIRGPLQATPPAPPRLPEVAAIQEVIKTENAVKMNKTNDNIEWAAWSWNPVTGCLHDCPYCYARDIAERFYPEKFQPSYHPGRLAAPDNTNAPTAPRWADDIGYNKVFTCSMADLFGKWVPAEWIESVLETVARNPQWTFLMLSKFPVRMAEFAYPPNVWLGTTVDRQHAVHRAETAFTKIKASGFGGVCWLSCEPMLERLTFGSLGMFDWVVMGGASRSTQTPEYRPPFDDIVHLYDQARAAGCRVYQKTNLIPGMADEQRIREYPQEALL